MTETSITRTLRSQWTQIDGLRIHALVNEAEPPSNHPPIVFIHGLGVSSRYMIPTITELMPHFRVYAPDLPGFGESQKPPRPMSVVQLAESLSKWIDAQNLSHCILVCNSMGCQVAVQLAFTRPDLIDRLILSGPTMEPTAPSAFTQILRLLRDSIHEKPSLLLIAVSDYIRAGPLRVLETLRMAVADHVETKLPHVTAKTLVVRGSLDPVAPQKWVEQMAVLLPHGRLAVIEGAGHAVNYSAAKEFASLIRKFVA